jgi:hypothetical protein
MKSHLYHPSFGLETRVFRTSGHLLMQNDYPGIKNDFSDAPRSFSGVSPVI